MGLDKINITSSSGTTSTSSESGFSEPVTASNTPFVQSEPLYDLIPANFREYTSSGGSTGVSNRKFFCTSGTTTGGYGAIQSLRSVVYKPGVSVMARVSGYFGTPAANTWQGMGFISIGDELSFGYSGTTFGIWHRQNGLAEVRTITVSSAATGAETLTLTLNSVEYSIDLTSGTTAHNAYEIANALTSDGTWYADNVDSTVIIAAKSDSAKSGTYSFSSTGDAAGSIALNTTGVTKTSTFIAQSSWNQSVASFLDPSKGNIYQIIFKNMGYGGVFFYVDNPQNGIPLLVHILKYQNTSEDLVIGNSNMHLGNYVVNLGSSSSVSCYVASFSGFLQGSPERIRNPRALSATATVGTTYLNILTIRNRNTYNGYINQIEVQPLSATVSSESAKNVVVEIRATSDTGVEQQFIPAGTNLVVDYDVSAVTLTGGRLLGSYTIPAGGTVHIDLQEYDIVIPPGIHLMIQAKVTGGSSSPVSASIVWYEDV